MTTLTVALLGEPQVRDAAGPIECPSRKAFALLCYLAHTGTPQPRSALARLFWDDADPGAARASLRSALARLPPPLAAALVTGRETVAVAPGLEVDTARLARLAAREDLAALDEAASLCRGPFLHGVAFAPPTGFDDWLARERASWRERAHAVLERAIAGHHRHADRDTAEAAAALALARHWCTADPAAEAAHRWLIRLHVEAGRLDEARVQFESCRRELAIGSGRVPSEETRALLEPAATARPTAKEPAPLPARSAGDGTRERPAFVVPGLPGTRFFGRETDLAALEDLLLVRGARLVTLHAMGGMGKTRLAAALAERLAGRWAQGVAWTALDDAPAAAQLPRAIAGALGIDLPPTADPLAALCAALRAQERLVVLDNFEPLLAAGSGAAAVDTVLALLDAAPGLRLLVTSREVLGLADEQVYPLEGLPGPPRDAVPGTPAEYPAAALFVQRARQADAAFAPASQGPAIARLCALVEGLPLALELAAAWVRSLSCERLVAAIETAAGALESTHRNRAARHRNLDAVVRTSWDLLQGDERRALAPLAVFVGGFGRDAACAVAETGPDTLVALVDKALVRRRSDGRLGLHELVRQFLAERLLEADAAASARRRHADWHARFLLDQRGRLDGRDGLEAHVALTDELPNLMVAAEAWQQTALTGALAEAWLVVLNGRGLQRTALEWGDRLLGAHLLRDPAEQALVQVQRGVARIGVGDSAGADADFAAAAALARAEGVDRALAVALVHRSLVGLLRDDDAFVGACLAELEPLLSEDNDPATLVRARYYDAMRIDTRGRNREALARYEETLALAERLGVSQAMRATLQTAVARTDVHLGRFEAAEALLGPAVEVHTRIGNRPRLAQALLARAQAQLGLDGGAARALDLADECLRLHEQSGHPPGISSAEHVRGIALRALGQPDAARGALERAAAIDSPILKGEALVDLGLLELEAGARPRATAIALTVLDLARAHALASLRWGAALLVSALALESGTARHAAAGWLDALLADPDVDIHARREAQALRRRAGEAPDVAVPSPVAATLLDAAALDEMGRTLASLSSASVRAATPTAAASP